MPDDPPTVTIHTQLRFHDVLELNRALPKSRISRCILWATAFIMLAMVYTITPPPGKTVDRSVVWLFSAMFAGLGFATPWLAAFSGWSWTIREPHTTEVTEAGIVRTTGETSASISWNDIYKLIETPSIIALRLRSSDSSLIFPKRDLADQTETLRFLARQHLQS